MKLPSAHIFVCCRIYSSSQLHPMYQFIRYQSPNFFGYLCPLSSVMYVVSCQFRHRNYTYNYSKFFLSLLNSGHCICLWWEVQLLVQQPKSVLPDTVYIDSSSSELCLISMES